MKNSYFKIFCISLLGLWEMGCQPATNYEAYEDRKKKGEQVFIKDVQNCQVLVNRSTKRSEGSEGAGERMNRERFIFKSCMKKNDWILKS
jgi:hypothetical protein